MRAVRAFVNSDTESRVWPGIQRPDGSTLQLDPGEVVEELELPGDFEDEYLKPIKPKATKPSAGTGSTSGEGAK